MKYVQNLSRSAFVNKFVNFIVSEYENKVFIEATDFSNFIVVKGISLDKEIIDLIEIKEEFKERNPEYFSSREHFNIIDLIDYDYSINLNDSVFSFTYYNSTRPIYHPEVLKFVEENKSLMFETLSFSKKIIVQCDEGSKNEYFENITFDFPSISYKSSFPNGLSNKSKWKILFYYGEYISYNLFKILLTDKITLDFQVDLPSIETTNLDKINVIVTANSQYDDSTITSLVLDVFDFNITKFKDEFLNNYDFQQEIDFPFESKPWLVYNKSKDLIII